MILQLIVFWIQIWFFTTNKNKTKSRKSWCLTPDERSLPLLTVTFCFLCPAQVQPDGLQFLALLLQRGFLQPGRSGRSVGPLLQVWAHQNEELWKRPETQTRISQPSRCAINNSGDGREGRATCGSRPAASPHTCTASACFWTWKTGKYQTSTLIESENHYSSDVVSAPIIKPSQFMLPFSLSLFLCCSFLAHRNQPWLSVSPFPVPWKVLQAQSFFL